MLHCVALQNDNDSEGILWLCHNEKLSAGRGSYSGRWFRDRQTVKTGKESAMETAGLGSEKDPAVILSSHIMAD
jgi:hypothetical protein